MKVIEKRQRNRKEGKISQIVRSCNFVSRLDLNTFLLTVVSVKQFRVKIIHADAYFLLLS